MQFQLESWLRRRSSITECIVCQPLPGRRVAVMSISNYDGEDASCKILRFRIFHFWYSGVTVEEKRNHIIPFLNLGNLTETTDCRAGGSSGGGPTNIPISQRVFPTRPNPSPSLWIVPMTPRAGDLRNGVGATGNGLVAALALPDTNSLALDGVLAAEGADVTGVLGDFHLLHLLTQGGTVSVEIGQCLVFLHLIASRSKKSSWIKVVQGDSEGTALSIPGTVFTGDTDLCERLLASLIPGIKKGIESLEEGGWGTYSWCAWSSCLRAAVGLKMSSEEIEKSLRKSGCGWARLGQVALALCGHLITNDHIVSCDLSFLPGLEGFHICAQTNSSTIVPHLDNLRTITCEEPRRLTTAIRIQRHYLRVKH